MIMESLNPEPERKPETVKASENKPETQKGRKLGSIFGTVILIVFFPAIIAMIVMGVIRH